MVDGVGVVRGLDVLHERGEAIPRPGAGQPHRQRRVPPRGDLDRVERGKLLQQRLVAVEAVHGHAQVEPVGRVVERVQGAVVAPRGQAVEVLEHDAVPAAHAGVLGHVGDAELALGRAHVPALEPVAPAVPERFGAGCVGRARRRQLGHGDRGEVVDAQADLPRAQRPVDRCPRHGQRVVERADAVDGVAAQVQAGAGVGDDGHVGLGLLVVGRAAAVAVAEAAGRARVVEQPAGPYRGAVGVELAGADAGAHLLDVARVLLEAAGVPLQHLHEAVVGDDLGAEHDDVVRGGGDDGVQRRGGALGHEPDVDLQPARSPARGAGGALAVAGHDHGHRGGVLLVPPDRALVLAALLARADQAGAAQRRGQQAPGDADQAAVAQGQAGAGEVLVQAAHTRARKASRGSPRARRQGPRSPRARPRARRCACPRRSRRRCAGPRRPGACAARRRRAGGAIAAATASGVGSGMRQFSPSTQKSRLPWASVQTTAPPVAIASSGGRQKPSCVEVWTNTVASLNSSLTSSSLGRLDVAARRSSSPSSGSMPNSHSSGRGAGSARQASTVSGRFFSGLVRPSASSTSSRRATPSSGAEARRGRSPAAPARRRSAELAQALAVPARRSSCSGTRGGRWRARGVRVALVVGVVATSRCPGRSRRGCRAARDAAPHRRRGVPPRRDLDRVHRRRAPSASSS